MDFYESNVQKAKDNLAISAVGDDGWNALMLASSNGHDKTVDLLINKGSDVSAVDNGGWNALMLASYNGHHKTVDLLINRGSDVKAVNEDLKNALMYACDCSALKQKIVEYLNANNVFITHFKIAEWKAKKYETKDVKCNNYISTQAEIFIGKEKAAKHLIKSGADINVIDTYGWSALMYAARSGAKAIVELLVKSGCDVLAVNKEGDNALAIASKYGYKDIVECLSPLYNSNVVSENADNEENGSLSLTSPETTISDELEQANEKIHEMHCNILKNNYKYLDEEIDGKFIIDFLLSKRILSLDDKQEVTAIKRRRKRTRALLDKILNAGSIRALPEFINSLKEHYPQAAEKLSKEL